MRSGAPLKAEPLLAEACRLEPGRTGPGIYWGDFTGQPYSYLLIRNGKYLLAEEAALTTVSRVKAELRKEGPWKTLAQLNASLGWVYSHPQLVEAQCRLGRFHVAETLVEEQLRTGAARPWTPAQIKSFKGLRLAVQSYSDQWREAAPGMVAACAETGQFDKAVATQKEAIAALTAEQNKQTLESRLKLYETKTPCRDLEQTD